VVVEGLDLVVVLTVLLLHTVSAVEHQLELVERTHLEARDASGTLLHKGVVHTGGTGGATQGVGVDEGVGAGEDKGGAEVVSAGKGVGGDEESGIHSNLHIGGVSAEVPHRVGVGEGVAVLVAPDKLLDGVVEVEADELGSSLADGRDGVATGVLQLLNQVLLRVGCEGGTLGGVEVHIVGPHLESVGIEVVGEVRGQVDIKANLSVLQGDEGQEETGVAVEEEE